MNVTPLVDVVLVLLITFMVITPLLTKTFWIHTPAQRTEEIDRREASAGSSCASSSDAALPCAGGDSSAPSGAGYGGTQPVKVSVRYAMRQHASAGSGHSR
jgi:hypothetical protein